MKSLQLFGIFFKIGAFTLGGGYAMIPLVQREVVDNRAWIDEEEFLDLIALAQSAPGIIAVNTAVFVGYKIAGWRGVVMSVLGATLPSFLIILLIAMCFTRFRDYPQVEAVFKGIRPAVVALIAAPLYKMAKAAKVTWKNLWIPVAAALLIWLGGVSPVLVIVAAILGGLGWTAYRANWANRANGANKNKEQRTKNKDPFVSNPGSFSEAVQKKGGDA